LRRVAARAARPQLNGVLCRLTPQQRWASVSAYETGRQKAFKIYVQQLDRTLGKTAIIDGPQEAKKSTTKFPLVLSGSAGKAAMLLFKNVYEAEGVEGLNRTQKELDVFLWSVEGKKEWNSLIYTPDLLVSRATKNAKVAAHLKAIGASPLFSRQLLGIFNSKVVHRLDQVVNDFHAIVRAYKREVDVRLTTKGELDKATLQFYKNTVALNYLEPEDNMIFAHDVDPTIVDGYRVVVKGQTFDLTANKVVAAKKAAEDAKFQAYYNSIVGLKGQPGVDSAIFEIFEDRAKNPEKYVAAWQNP